ncbi:MULTISPECIES: hypothetical protein [Thermomonosporaceae]|uniref:hypothetical protein n=1 Tax=Thermomonosporaceae TaxID=2012 RepID=UPI00255AFD56|nr:MULTISPECIES: hypothetical protein [Thermomonosporaceae]MDL4771803.1 hypothetical protein [Actinomadura xylanilytica]
MPGEPARFPFDAKQPCPVPECRRLTCFHVRLETAADTDRRAVPRSDDSCGTHLAETVETLMRWAKERKRYTSRVVIYATTEGRRTSESRPLGPFDRLALSAIPVGR